ncbi:hypothetical protein [Allokutzneria multivorans]|uniref:hypothetical protein n=1 Tax=Allokutzneria multivorans TaxID=1142134 RepID=UPI0031E72536
MSTSPAHRDHCHTSTGSSPAPSTTAPVAAEAPHHQHRAPCQHPPGARRPPRAVGPRDAGVDVEHELDAQETQLRYGDAPALHEQQINGIRLQRTTRWS